MQTRVIEGCQGRKTLLELLRENGAFVDALCGGNGKCGRCRVQIQKGADMPQRKEREVFSEQELADGWRLACVCRPMGKVVVRLPDEFVKQEKEPIFEQFSGSENATQTGHAANTNTERTEMDGKKHLRCGMAVDIGTTTLAASLVCLEDGKELRTISAVNRQRAYGADVIARISSSENGFGEELRQCIIADLCRLAEELTAGEKTVLEKVVIAGNTVMCHLLLGYPYGGLGRAPYTPFDLSMQNMTWRALTGKEDISAEVVILPGISAFVGADIAAGMYACGMKPEKKELLLDLGTNGEMVLGTGTEFLAASAPAGPALEGGNISCGMPAVPGAVADAVLYGRNTMAVKTIGKLPPQGLCGTGILGVVYELLIHGLIDTQGILKGPWFEKGFPVGKETILFTQEDIRQVQMAKAAVRTGVELLVREAGMEWSEISRVYLSGSFGFHLNIEKATALGMLPREVKNKITVVGNSALSGAKACLKDAQKDEKREKNTSTAEEKICRMASCTRTVSLAECPEFYESYYKYMTFGAE